MQIFLEIFISIMEQIPLGDYLQIKAVLNCSYHKGKKVLVTTFYQEGKENFLTLVISKCQEFPQHGISRSSSKFFFLIFQDWLNPYFAFINEEKGITVPFLPYLPLHWLPRHKKFQLHHHHTQYDYHEQDSGLHTMHHGEIALLLQ